MSEIAVVTQKQDERRKHERIGVPQNAVIAQDKKGKLLGMVRQLARGGMLIEGNSTGMKKGKKYTVTIVDDSEPKASSASWSWWCATRMSATLVANSNA
jgi:hypothetical protein